MQVDNHNIVLPDGDGGYTPCPELLNEEEAIRFLRLDTEPNPKGTLAYYRHSSKNQHRLRPTKIGKRNFYWVTELVRFIETQTQGVR